MRDQAPPEARHAHSVSLAAPRRHACQTGPNPPEIALSPPSNQEAKLAHAVEHHASKVPEVTLGFWIIKILATTLGKPAATP